MIVTSLISLEKQGDYKRFSDKTSILLEEEERSGIPRDCVSIFSIAQLTHDVCHMNQFPTVCDLHNKWICSTLNAGHINLNKIIIKKLYGIFK